MTKLTNKINKRKLRDKSCLLYKIQEKHSEHSKVSKCAILIGAGCSFPILPLGSGLIKICQQLAYIRNIFPIDAAKLINDFLQKADFKLLDDFITGKRKPKKTIEEFIQENELILKELINEEKDSFLKKVPANIIDPNWLDFEELMVNDAKYSFWMDTYSNSPKERQRLVEALIDNKNPGGAYIILALLIEMGYFSNILTTNFDDFINDALLYYTSTRPRFYADDELSQYISVYSGKPNIIKLHGDYRYANIKNTADETLRLSNKMEEKLKELLQNFDLIVVGYNGADYSIMNVLQQAKSPNCELLWCGMDENNVNWRVANLINDTENSWFIKMNSFDELIKDFYLNFVQSPPDLVTKAKKRQEEIKGFVIEYSIELQKDSETTVEEKNNLKNKDIIWSLYNKALKVQNPAERIKLCDEIIEKDDKYADAFNLRALSLRSLDKYEEAIKDYTKAIHLQKKAAFFNNRARSYRLMGEYEKALSDYNQAIKLEPLNANFFSNRGYTYLSQKDYKKAELDLTTAIGLNGNFANPYRHLAELLYEKQNYGDALDLVNKSIELKSHYPSAYKLRAKIYRVLKDDALAEDDEKMAKMQEGK